VYRRAGILIEDLAGSWNELVEILEEASQLAAANRLEAPGILAVEPVPSTFKSWLNLLLVAATDPAVHAPPHVQAMTETGIYGDRHGGASYETRPAGTQTIEVRRRLDAHDRLIHLLPDLRDIVRSLNLSGKIPTVSE
jgi:hypothetical protein